MQLQLLMCNVSEKRINSYSSLVVRAMLGLYLDGYVGMVCELLQITSAYACTLKG